MSNRVYVFVYLLTVYPWVGAGNTCSIFRPTGGLNTRLVHSSMVSFRTYSLNQCMDWCMHRTSCNSVNFVRHRQVCEMMDVNSTSYTAGSQAQSGYVHMDMAEWLQIRGDNPCSTKPCRHDQWCIVEKNASKCYPTAPGCREVHLVSGPYGVPDEQLTASSAEKNSDAFQAYRARLNSNTRWNPAGYYWQAYIQVQFNKSETLRGVVTQGFGLAWVTSYTIAVSTDCMSFGVVLDSDGTEMVFDGNTDGNTAVTNYFQKDVRASCLKLHPKTRRRYVALRFDVVGVRYRAQPRGKYYDRCLRDEIS